MKTKNRNIRLVALIITFNDETCIQFIKDRDTKLCIKLNSIGYQCNGEMKETLKNFFFKYLILGYFISY